MPTYPSRLHLEPFIEVHTDSRHRRRSYHRTIQSVQSYPNSVAVAFVSIFFSFSFQTLWISKLSSESSSTGQTMKSAQIQAPLTTTSANPSPAGQQGSDRSSDNGSEESHQSRGSNRSHGTGHTFGSYHEARIATPAQSEASSDQPRTNRRSYLTKFG